MNHITLPPILRLISSTLVVALAVGLAGLGGPRAHAEPFFAVKTGFQCQQCHVSPAGGGQRTAFGTIWAQNELANFSIPDQPTFTGDIGNIFRIGAQARLSGTQFEFDDQDDELNFEVDRVSVFLNAQVNKYVSIYVDQNFAPTTLNREAWVKFEYNNFYLRAGSLFLPHGLRIEDDTAFIREATGFNFNNNDDGAEFGFINDRWSVQLAITNGTNGVAETDDGKQFSARAAYTSPNWRLGVSGNRNDTDFGDREVYGVFAGFKTGPVYWLAEYDRIRESDVEGIPDVDQDVAFLEANIELLKGNFLKLTAESFTFDTEQEDQYRYSVVYEWFPWSFTELRLGFRFDDSDGDNPALNGEEAFFQANIFF